MQSMSMVDHALSANNGNLRDNIITIIANCLFQGNSSNYLIKLLGIGQFRQQFMTNGVDN